MRILLCLLSLIIFTGCSSLLNKNQGVNGKATKQTEKIQAKIDALDDKSTALDSKRLTTIGAFSSGVDYSLNKETNQTIPVITARELNTRILTLANKPDFNELEMIYKLVDTMITNRVQGEKLLAQKDKEIINLNKTIKDVQEERDKQTSLFVKQSEKNAAQADQYKSTLNELDSFWGVGAIIYGFKRLFTRALYVLIGIAIVYLILRFAAASSPIAASVFRVFERMGSWIVNIVQTFLPQAVAIAGNVTKQQFDNYKKTLTAIIDSVELLREKQDGLTKQFTIDDLLTEIAKSPMVDQGDRDRIDEIKKSLHWK